ncbi:hypothetical protein DFJ43DRAFT_1162135 [Lentinula guzmanii]|uniref:Uncharacterized protein n=1 Tax=Lentinula guzmanii TaxID=2804957 RepID=A0AA38J196_9AGAR|nr:hypothetical protein DFJ43DRAFT_1162135 [Lentinula guzmanii]
MPKKRKGRIENFNKGGKKWAIGTTARTAACKLGYNWAEEKGKDLNENDNPESPSHSGPNSDASPARNTPRRAQSYIFGNSLVSNTPSRQKSPIFRALSPVFSAILSPFHSPHPGSPSKSVNNHSHVNFSIDSREPSVNLDEAENGTPRDSEPEMFTDPAFLDGEAPVPHEDTSDAASISSISSEDSSILEFDKSGVMALEALHHLQTVLRPAMSGSRKRMKNPEINNWSKSHLEEVEHMLNLYTTPESSTYREWQQSSIQASIVLRKNHTQVSTPTSKIHTRNAKSLPVLASAGPKAYSCNGHSRTLRKRA